MGNEGSEASPAARLQCELGRFPRRSRPTPPIFPSPVTARSAIAACTNSDCSIANGPSEAIASDIQWLRPHLLALLEPDGIANRSRETIVIRLGE
jgi:hypothetical protein